MIRDEEGWEMKSHKDLDVWNMSMDLVELVYRHSAAYPKEEIYGLTSQVRRAVVSVPSNIAEGAARQGNKEFVQFLYIALGSLAEVETQVMLAKRLHFAEDVNDILQSIQRIRKMLNGLIAHQKRKIN